MLFAQTPQAEARVSRASGMSRQTLALSACLLLVLGAAGASAQTTTTTIAPPTTTTTMTTPTTTVPGSAGCVVPPGANLVVSDLSDGVTPANLASALVGTGVAVSNVTFTGQAISAGAFTDAAPVTGIPSGVILSSGCGKTVGGSNLSGSTTFVLGTNGDPDLDTLIPGYTTFDATVLEFDFVPQSDTIQLRYVFASEEYNEWVNTSYNDVFGFFVNGANQALLPDATTTVAINNVNSGNPAGTAASNPTFHRNNDCADPACPLNIEADGLTTELILTASVLLNQTNHLKIAVADAGDQILDSWIFLEAGSFRASENCGNTTDDDGDGLVDDSDDDCWVCGDGDIDPGEDCDDGNVQDDDGCAPLCGVTSTCGNNVLEGQEACDDGNTVDNDGCSSHCVVECLANCSTTTTTTLPDSGACCLPHHGSCEIMTEAACDSVDGSFTSAGILCSDPGVCDACIDPVPDCNDHNPCTDDSCDQATGCVNAPNTAVCDDGDPCTLDDICNAGACAGAAEDCADTNPCTDDSCNAVSGACEHADNAAVCDDSDPCTVGDACVAGVCEGTVKDCADTNACTDDSCNPGTGACEHADNTAQCDDGDPCTLDDMCNAGACAGAAKDCADANPCTEDSCNAVSGACEHADNAAVCDDSDPCTVGDTCVAGVCEGTVKDCADTNPCTDDSCNAGTGACEHADNTAPCDDGDPCTLDDICNAGACAGAAKDCTDTNSCTDDSCNAGTGACEHADNAAICDDSDPCTVGDACVAGVCEGTVKDCADTNACTDDSCNPGTGACEHADNTAQCDDGNACTLSDTCSAGTCAGRPVIIPAACKWVMVGGNPTKRVGARTRGATSVTGHICGDALRIGVDSTTNGDVVSTMVQGNGITLSASSDVLGDVLTDGAAVRSVPRRTLLPGLAVDTLPGGQTAVHSLYATRDYDTTGNDTRVDECNSAQSDIASSAALIAALPWTQQLGAVSVLRDQSLTIHATNVGGLNVVEIQTLQGATRSTITLDGGGDPATSFILRVQRKLDIKLQSRILLAGGLDASRVILFGQTACRFGEEVSGAGTVLCPNAKLLMEERTTWNGALMGGKGIVELRDSGTLTHVPLKLGS